MTAARTRPLDRARFGGVALIGVALFAGPNSREYGAVRAMTSNWAAASAGSSATA